MPSSNDISQFSLPPFANQLIQSGYINLPQLQQALIEKRNSNRPLIEILQSITGRSLPPDLVRQYRQEHLFNLKVLHGVEVFDPDENPLDWSKIEQIFKSLLPFEICRRYQLLPLQKQDSQPLSLILAMVTPGNPEILEDLRRILRTKNIKFERRVIAQQDYNKLIEQYLNHIKKAESSQRQPKEQDLETLVDITDIFEDIQPSSNLRQEEPAEDLSLIKEAHQGPVVTLVNNILVKAIENKASEIHLEPQENQLMVRFRQDGLMCQAFEPFPQQISSAVLSRLKILADLDLSNRHQPQKERIQKTFSGRKIDFGIHTLPTHYGEKIVLRVFDSKSGVLTLNELVTLEETRNLLGQLLHHPSGLLLVTGPSGSGTSTTFYSLLAHCNQAGVNISTVEDPIERVINGITQVEINPDKNIDYPAILRSFSQQDVDSIGVDQIRDPQVAKMIVDTALNGDLVITSLPVNDAASGIVRLTKMGIDSSLAAEALVGVVNQRLVRRVCAACCLKHTPSPEELAKFGLSTVHQNQATFYKAHTLTNEEKTQAREKGRLCRHCNGLGYQGQIGVYEVMGMTSRLKSLISQGTDTETLKAMAIQEGMRPLLHYALELVFQGQTTLEEIERVMPDALKENLFQAKSEVVAPCVVSSKVTERLQEIEKLLETLNTEFRQLKQEFEAKSEPSEAKLPSFAEELTPSLPWETLPRDLDLDKETLVSDASAYEELTDPGDWEKLKRELDPDKETMVAEDFDDDPSSWEVDSSFRSVSDPWS